MSVKQINLVWEYSRQTGVGLLLLLAIADHANDEGVAWPSHDRLALKIRRDRRSVKRIVRRIMAEDQPELKLVRPGGAGARSTNLYKLTIDTSQASMSDKVTASRTNKGDSLTPLDPIRGTNGTNKGDKTDQIRGAKLVDKGGPGTPRTIINHHIEPNAAASNTRTSESEGAKPAAAAADVWEMGQLYYSSQLPKKHAKIIGRAGDPAGTVFVSKYLYALARPRITTPALWAADQVADDPIRLAPPPFDQLAGLGRAGLAEVLAWLRDDGANPLDLNGAMPAALKLRGDLKDKFKKDPARLVAAVEDAITDLGLVTLLPAPAAEAPAEPYQPPAPLTPPDPWQALVKRIEPELTGGTYTRLTAHTRFVREDGDLMIVAAPALELDWLTVRMIPVIKRHGQAVVFAALEGDEK